MCTNSRSPSSHSQPGEALRHELTQLTDFGDGRIICDCHIPIESQGLNVPEKCQLINSPFLPLSDRSSITMSQLEECKQVVRHDFIDNGLHHCQLGRLTVVDDLLQQYTSNPELPSKELRAKFVNEKGLDGGGLLRELFTLFWEQVHTG